MNITELLFFLNSNRKESYIIEKSIFHNISLHTRGILPSYKHPSTGRLETSINGNEVYQDIFEKKLLSRHPRESEVTRNWRYSQYKPFTKQPFEQIIDIVSGAIFQDGQYSIVLNKQGDYDYIYGKNFKGLSLINYFSNIIIRNVFEDPNGYIVRLPKKSADKYLPTEEVQVDIVYIPINKVILKATETDFVYYSDDKTIFWINTENIKIITKNNEGRWANVSLYYNHKLGKLPVNILGGKHTSNGIYDSYLDKAIPIADEFISSYSAEQLLDKEASHPFIQQASIDCPTCDGNGKVNNGYGEETSLETCKTCKGNKQISINPADRFEVSLDKMDIDMIKIINPNITINEYHRLKNKELMQSILDALNLTLINEAQSGTAKAIDQEKLYQFISNISNHIFDNLIFDTINDIIGYRNVKSENGQIKPDIYEFTFVKPQQFSIKTANDLLNELVEMQNAKAPIIIRNKLISEFIDKRFANDDLFEKKYKVIAKLDKLMPYSLEEIQIMSTIGILNTEEYKFSQKLPLLLDKLEQDKGQEFILKSSIELIQKEIENYG